MSEHDDLQEQQSPRWVPYTPPPLDGWDRVRFLVRRYSFPVIVLLFLASVAGGLYWSLNVQAPVTPPDVSVMPQATQVQAGERTARLTVRSVPDGASVRVNGDSIGATPVTKRPLNAGVYMLSVRAKGYFRADTVIVLGAGTEPTLRMTLRPRPGTEVASGATEAPARASPPPARPSTSPPRARRPLPETAVPARPSPVPQKPVYGTLYVTSTPSGATVRVDGAEKGRAPVSLSNVSPGSVRIGVSLEGYEDWTTEVEVAPNATRQVRATLQPRSGLLRVLVRPWGTIYVNGALVARESDIWYETTLPAGSYRVTAVHPALGQRVQEVEVSSEDETSVVIDLTETESSAATP